MEKDYSLMIKNGQGVVQGVYTIIFAIHDIISMELSLLMYIRVPCTGK